MSIASDIFSGRGEDTSSYTGPSQADINRPQTTLPYNVEGPLAYGQTRGAAPAPPQPSTIQKVGNWFENLGAGLWSGIKTTLSDTYMTAKTAAAEAVVGFGTELQNTQTWFISNEIQRASQLPTKEQRKDAISRIPKSINFVPQWATDQLNQQYEKLGFTDKDSTFTMLRKSASQAMNTAFGATMFLGGPLENAAKVAEDTISGSLVKLGIGSAESISEGTARTVGEDILNSAGGSARQTLEELTKGGTKILTQSAARRVAGEMLNAGITNSIVGAVDQWSKGNNATNQEERNKYLQSIGMGFLTGLAFGGVAEGTRTYFDLKAGGKISDQVKSKLSQEGLTDTEQAGWKSQLNQINPRLGTDYGMNLGKSQAQYLNKMSDAYIGVVRETRAADVASEAEARLQNIREQNLEQGRRTQALQTLNRSRSSLDSLVRDTPIFGSYDEASTHLTKDYGVEINPTNPEDNIRSIGNRSKITFKSGDFVDYVRQVSKTIPRIIQEKGVSMSFFKDELSQIPDTGVKELDTPQSKMATVIEGLNSKNSANFRDQYPLVSSSFDAVHGVVKKMTPRDAAQAFVRDNLGSMYSDIQHTIEKESVKVTGDEVSGQAKVVYDPTKNEKLWLDAQDLVLKGKSKSAVLENMRKTVEKSDQVSTLRDAAARAGKDPKLQAAFEKADTIANSMPSLDQKIKFWNDHLKTFGIQPPQAESRFGKFTSPTGSPLGTSTEVPAPEIPAVKAEPVSSSTEAPVTNEPTTGGKTSKLAEGVQAKAIENNLTEKLGDLPEYTQVSMKDQAEKAAILLAHDYERSVRIATGQEEPPSGLLPESVFISVENKAISDGDVNMLRQLAQSSRTVEASIMGQRIRVLAERDPYSPVSAMNDLAKARSDAYEAKTGNKVEKSIDSAVKDMKKNIPKQTKSSFTKFIDDITCK